MQQLHDNRVRIRVASNYLPEKSAPADSRFFFTYTVTITNVGSLPCQLLSRHWIISDAFGNEQEVRGAGVVGQQPRIEVGQSYSYTSFCPLTTPLGSMRGSYQFQNAQGEMFEGEIPQFSLSKEKMVN